MYDLSVVTEQLLEQKNHMMDYSNGNIYYYHFLFGNWEKKVIHLFKFCFQRARICCTFLISLEQ